MAEETAQLHLPKDTHKMLKKRANAEGKKVFRLADEIIKRALKRKKKEAA